MCSYSSMTFSDNASRSHNTPACASEYLLTDTIRTAWNWSGYVLSDAGATAFVANTTLSPDTAWGQECGVDTPCTFGHGFAANASDAAVKALSAGMDIELTCCGAPQVFPTLPDSVRSGHLDEFFLDRALRNTLPFRFELGQLDGLDSRDVPPRNPYAADIGAANVTTPAMHALALRAAKRSIVLLKNTVSKQGTHFGRQAGQLLPLSPTSLNGKIICAVGPNVNNTLNLLGNYVNKAHSNSMPTIASALQHELAAARSFNATLRVSSGCRNNTACDSLDPQTVDLLSSSGSCDLIVVAAGLTADARESNAAEGGTNACGCPEGNAVEGECCDRTNDAFPGEQLKLIQLAANSSAPVILLTVNAGQLDLTWPSRSGSGVDAILNLIYPGQASGTAVAQVLLGIGPDANPAARLPITYYSDMDVAGDITNYSMHQRTYRYSAVAGSATFPFGFGLGYSPFVYESVTWTRLSTPASVETIMPKAPTIRPCDAIQLNVTVRNTGYFDGDEVVQLYVTLPNTSSVPVAKLQLSSFARLHIPRGQVATVSFTVVPEDHSVLRNNSDFAAVIEPGVRRIWVGGSSDASRSPGLQTSFVVSGTEGEQTLLSSCPRGKAMQWLQSSTQDAARWSPSLPTAKYRR
eukprot:INCI3660.3.p1 GENE.INCI3660.3~~INCI3660.3.p1  ORF type:complete len:636 (+),score=69.63 INCI3660.3:252-2159(+)